MKAKVRMILLTGCLLGCLGSMTSSASPDTDQKENQVILQASPDLQDLARQWTESFNGLQSDFTAGTGTDGRLVLGTSLSDQSAYAWKTVAGRNPVLFIYSSGFGMPASPLSKSTLNRLIDDQSLSVWISDREESLLAFSQFSGRNAQDVKGVGILSGEALKSRMEQTDESLCIVPWTQLSDPESLFSAGRVMAVDPNGDGVLEPVENIYKDAATFMRGVWIGKYPRELSVNLMLFASHAPLTAPEEALVRYILTAGQGDLGGHLFAALTYSEQLSGLSRIPVAPVAVGGSLARSSNLAILLAGGALLALLLVVWFVAKWKRIAHRIPAPENYQPVALIPEQIHAPGGLLFDPAHTWTFMEQDGAIKLGIDDFLQHVTGPITRIEMKQNGGEVKKGEVIAVIAQNGKKIEVLSPVSGKIVNYNAALNNSPALLNRSPFDKGWIYRIEPTNWRAENQSMIQAADYRDWLKKEFTRFKDFLQHALSKQQVQYATVALNDGGEILDEILSQFGPETWEDFGNTFIKPSKLN